MAVSVVNAPDCGVGVFEAGHVPFGSLTGTFCRLESFGAQAIEIDVAAADHAGGAWPATVVETSSPTAWAPHRSS